MSKSNANTKANSEEALLVLSVLFVVILGYILWQIFQSPVTQILKSLICGLLLIYYSWELTYFDSIVPGIMPASPLSPTNIKKLSGPTLHSNNAIALINGAFFALFINWWA